MIDKERELEQAEAFGTETETMAQQRECAKCSASFKADIAQAINHEANEWIVAVSEALGQGFFVYDPSKLGRAGSIKRALDRVIAQARTDTLREVGEAIEKIESTYSSTDEHIKRIIQALKSGQMPNP